MTTIGLLLDLFVRGCVIKGRAWGKFRVQQLGLGCDHISTNYIRTNACGSLFNGGLYSYGLFYLPLHAVANEIIRTNALWTTFFIRTDVRTHIAFLPLWVRI